MNIGRSIPEILRVLQALQCADENQASMPANWTPCEPVILQPPKTLEGIIEKNSELIKNKNGINWYLSFRQPNKCELLGDE